MKQFSIYCFILGVTSIAGIFFFVYNIVNLMLKK